MRSTIATITVDMLDDGTYVALLRRDEEVEPEHYAEGDSIPEALHALASEMVYRAQREFDPRRRRPV